MYRRCAGGAQGLNFFTLVLGRLDELNAACTENDDFYRSNENDDNESKVRTRCLTLSVDWDISDSVTLSSISAYREIYEMNASWGWANDFFGDFSNSIDVRAVRYSPYDQYSQEFRFSGVALNDRFSWTAGIYGFRESGTQFIDVPFWGDGEVVNPDPAEAPLYYAPFAPGLSLGQFASSLSSTISRRQETHATNKSWAWVRCR